MQQAPALLHLFCFGAKRVLYSLSLADGAAVSVLLEMGPAF
jgi:hypothetical protein